MSNAELRMLNEEEGIRILTQMVLLKQPSTLYLVLCTLYFAFLPQAGPSSCYWLLETFLKPDFYHIQPPSFIMNRENPQGYF